MLGQFPPICFNGAVAAVGVPIVQAAAFALAPGSPARGAATDGKDIGADLSIIPTIPPSVEAIVMQMLSAK